MKPDRTRFYRFAALVILIAVFLILSRRFVAEDGLIYARYMTNALQGHGLVFNLGERVNALTSPFFTYLLLAVSWLLRGAVVPAEFVVFGVTFTGACLLAEELAPFAGLFVAATAYFYTVIGMETSTFLFMLMLTIYAFEKKRYDWLPLLVVLTALTRFEAGLLIPIVAWELWRERKFPRLFSLLPPVALLVLYFALNYYWYGAILPNSATSKLGQARSGFWPHWPWGFLTIRVWAVSPGGVFRATLALVPLVLVFSLAGWLVMRRTRADRIILPFSVGLFAFYFFFNIPSYHWYYAPFFFFLILYAARGMLLTKPTFAVMLFAIFFSCLRNAPYVKGMTISPDYTNIANWINQNTPPDATIESSEIGAIGWLTHRRINDIIGLTEPKNADHIAHGDFSSWLREDKPDYIIVHRPTSALEQSAIDNPNYREVPFHSGHVYLLQRVTPK